MFEKMKNIVTNNDEFIVLDLETTGFKAINGSRITEIGAVKIKDGKKVDVFHSLINPERPITEKITELTGITNEMVKDKPIYQQILPDFYKFIGNTPIVAHNAVFDWDDFLIPLFETVGIYPTNEVIDTLELAKVIDSNSTSKSLGSLCKKYNISLVNAHRAIDDAVATASLFLIYRKYLLSNFPNQISLTAFTNNEKPIIDERIVKQKVIDINLWEREFEKKSFKRLYIELTHSKVFYDILGDYWQIQETNYKVDLNDIKKQSLLYLQTKKQNLYNTIKPVLIYENKNFLGDS